jgi:integrase
MSTTQDNLDWFENRITGRRVQADTAAKYRRWVKRYETWRPRAEPDIGQLIDFDTMLADSEWTDYPWENATGRPAPDAYSYSSRRVALSAAKLWLRLHHDVEIIEEVQNIVSGEPDPFEPKYLSMDDAESIIENATDDCNCSGCQAALAISYDAILRGAEMCKVRVDDVDLDARTLYVNSVKGSFRTTVSLAPRTVELVRRHIREHDPKTKLFTNTYDNGWKAESWHSHFRRNHHEAGSHSFGRHSPIVHRLQHPEEFDDMDPNADVFGQVYRRARHKAPQMTTRYARLVGIDVPDWAGE